MIELHSLEQVRCWFAESEVDLSPTTCKEPLLAALRSATIRLTEQYARETGYSHDDSKALVEAAVAFLDQYESRDASLLGMEECGSLSSMHVSNVPWGRVIIALPSNAVLPLAVILGFAFMQAGNRVVLSAPRNGKGTMEIIASCFAAAGCPLAWYSSGSRTLVDACLAERGIDCLYFVGGSSHYAEIAGRCAAAGIELIYEGEGRGAMVVDASLTDSQVRAAANCLFESKRLWSGRMCSAPNFVVVAKNQAIVFVDEFDRLARAAEPSESPAEMSAACVGFLESRLRGGDKLVPARSRLEDTRTPVLLWRDSIVHDGAEAEMFGPVTLGSAYRDEGELLEVLGKSRFGLQLTIFSVDQRLLSRVVRTSRVARVCVNMLPVNQDPSFAWGAYGLSGRSEVCTFVEKAYRRVLIECWGGPPDLRRTRSAPC